MAKPAIAVVGEADLILAGEMSGGEPAPLLQGGGAGDRYRLPTSGGNTLASAVDQPGWMAGDGSSLADERLKTTTTTAQDFRLPFPRLPL